MTPSKDAIEAAAQEMLDAWRTRHDAQPHVQALADALNKILAHRARGLVLPIELSASARTALAQARKAGVIE